MAEGRTVLVALGMLRSHYPGDHPAIDEATVVAWHGSGLAALPDDALLTAAAEWDTVAHHRFPSSGEFARECQRQARKAMDAARVLAEETGAPVPTEIVGGVRLPVKSVLDRAYVRAIRVAFEAQARGESYREALNAELAAQGIPIQEPML